MRSFCLFSVLMLTVFFVGCGSDTSKQNNTTDTNKAAVESSKADEPSSQNGVNYDELRKKANVAEAASVVGYDGKAIKNELNKVIDVNEKMNKQLNDIDL